MSFNKLDTKPFADAANATKVLAETLDVSIESTDKAINSLYGTWAGKGRNAFEKKYKVFEHQISDIRKGIWDLYEDIINAENTYMQTDEEVAGSLVNAKKQAGRSEDFR